MKSFLKLYITGHSVKSQEAIRTLHRICHDEFREDYEIEIIDVLENPQLAEDERILATPTVVKELPPPIRRVIGDLSEREKVLMGLDLVSSSIPVLSHEKGGHVA
ncbi:MAG: circadian clock protein KaiB [Nitrospirales bacterium]|nr:circadian clock protein KaiB [Nitrospira sp.]MDR4503073.1 circadian clock protein KaiB [Nitrospirales bacterium]